MAEEEKPQAEAAEKAAPKKAARKKASTKKRAAPKKRAAKKRVAKKSATPTSETEIRVTLEKGSAAAATSGSPTPQNAVPTPQVWWRAALMIGVVVLVFSYIRQAAHDDGITVNKGIAPSPWASDAPLEESAQPHPWELAPLPEGNDFAAPQPYAPQPGQQAYPGLDPWQPSANAVEQTPQPYYPPPPGYYSSQSAPTYQR